MKYKVRYALFLLLLFFFGGCETLVYTAHYVVVAITARTITESTLPLNRKCTNDSYTKEPKALCIILYSMAVDEDQIIAGGVFTMWRLDLKTKTKKKLNNYQLRDIKKIDDRFYFLGIDSELYFNIYRHYQFYSFSEKDWKITLEEQNKYKPFWHGYNNFQKYKGDWYFSDGNIFSDGDIYRIRNEKKTLLTDTEGDSCEDGDLSEKANINIIRNFIITENGIFFIDWDCRSLRELKEGNRSVKTLSKEEQRVLYLTTDSKKIYYSLESVIKSYDLQTRETKVFAGKKGTKEKIPAIHAGKQKIEDIYFSEIGCLKFYDHYIYVCNNYKAWKKGGLSVVMRLDILENTGETLLFEDETSDTPKKS